jgi:hypothetical protein
LTLKPTISLKSKLFSGSDLIFSCKFNEKQTPCINISYQNELIDTKTTQFHGTLFTIKIQQLSLSTLKLETKKIKKIKVWDQN